MKVAIFSKFKVTEEMENKVKGYGLIYSEKKPEIVISLGGDGTYLMSERMWPGIPKLIVRQKSICKKGEVEGLESALEKISNGKYKIVENIKLETKFRRKKVVCVNEFSIRNRYATSALRFFVWINDDRTEEVIGDGVVICTPFGSTGYYQSIGGKSFESGIGIGFNNPTKKMKNMVLPEDSIIKVKINRGDAVLTADNNPQVFIMSKGEVLTIKKSEDVARIVDIIEK